MRIPIILRLIVGGVLTALAVCISPMLIVGGHRSPTIDYAAYEAYDSAIYPMKITFTGYHGDTATALRGLRREIDDLFDNRAFAHATTSVKVVLFEPNDSLHLVYQRDPNLYLPPASVEKMFTSSSTIWALGSKYQFRTKLDLAPGAKLTAGMISGNVIIRPSGDPTLRSSDLQELADELRYKGVTEIRGDVISDLAGEDVLAPQAKKDLATKVKAPSIAVRDTTYDNALAVSDDGAHPKDSKLLLPSELPPAYAKDSGDSVSSDEDSDDSDDDEESDPGALSEYANFSIDRNIVAVTVTAGRSKGAKVAVHVSPMLGQVIVVNHGKTGAAASGRRKKRVRIHHRWKTIYVRTRTRSTLRVSSVGGPEDARQVVTVSGVLPARSARTYSFAIRNVPLAMAAMMKFYLTRSGIRVTGGYKSAEVVQKGEPITVAEKDTKLMELLAQMNKRSDNYLAQSMFRKLSTIVSVAANAPDERARKLMRSWLRVCNADETQCMFIDGSGLSHSNRVSANTVIELLRGIKQQGMFDLFTRTLSIAGYDGTLRNRMIGTPAQYNAHGKTGTLSRVTALAGYVITGDGQLAAYFMTMQNFRGGLWAYKNAQNKVVEALASFRYSNYSSLSPK